jgi:hypothetical protein
LDVLAACQFYSDQIIQHSMPPIPDDFLLEPQSNDDFNTVCDIEPSKEIQWNLLVEGVHPLPHLPPISRLAKVCEHHRPKRLCLGCRYLMDSQPVAEPASLSSTVHNGASKFYLEDSVNHSGHVVTQHALIDLAHALPESVDCSPDIGSFHSLDEQAEAEAVALLMKKVQAAAEAAVARHTQLSNPARIMCMALVQDKSQCQMPGIYPDDGDMWFCGLHKDRQKYGVIDNTATSSFPFSPGNSLMHLSSEQTR